MVQRARWAGGAAALAIAGLALALARPAGVPPAIAPMAAATASPWQQAPMADSGRADPAAAARGARSFAVWCNSCHPNGGAGNGPPLWGDGVALTPERIRAQVRHGSAREVARFTTLSEERLDDIIAFILVQAGAVPAPRAGGG